MPTLLISPLFVLGIFLDFCQMLIFLKIKFFQSFYFRIITSANSLESMTRLRSYNLFTHQIKKASPFCSSAKWEGDHKPFIINPLKNGNP